jgi:hypothetical protein
MLKLSSEDLRKRREHLKNQYGFTIEEQRYVARRKPNFLLYDKDENKGIASLSDLLTGKYGFSQELVRTLVLKYPQVLGKSKSSIEHFFD